MDYVNPLIESNKGRWFFMNSASWPQGMVNLSPDTKMTERGRYGYVYDSTDCLGFSHLHGYCVAGLRVMPTTGAVNPLLGEDGWKSGFSHATEVAKPGYHKVELDRYKITAELTATTRVGLHKYTFKEGGKAEVLFQIAGLLDEVTTTMLGGRITAVSDMALEGYFNSTYVWAPGVNYRVFFVAEFDKPFDRFNGWSGGHVFTNVPSIEGSYSIERLQSLNERIAATTNGVGGSVTFNQRKAGESVSLKVAVSFASIEGAKRNLREELSGWDFDAVYREARKEWNRKLSVVEVTGGTEADQVKFYTDLYHTLLGRNICSDVDGAYPDYGQGGFESFKIKHLPTKNIAPLAAVTASSGHAKALIDTVAATPGNAWLTREPTPWVKLEWRKPKRINRVDLFDTLDSDSHISAGVLSFSDGSTVNVEGIQNDGTTQEILFPEKTVKWVKFQATAGTGEQRGLTELKAYEAGSKADFALHYSDSFWWNMTNLYPLWATLYPEMVKDLVNTAMVLFENDTHHRMMRGATPGKQLNVMTSFQMAPLFATAITCDIEGINKTAMYEALKYDATRALQLADTPQGLEDYLELGFIPADYNIFGSGQTVEHSYCDWSIAQIARELGRPGDYDYFINRSRSWVNQFNEATGYQNSRHFDGRWKKIDVTKFEGSTFCESTAAIMTFFGGHDVTGLANAMGGVDTFAEKLDFAFDYGSKLHTPFCNGYGYGYLSYDNNNGLNMSYLFNYVGKPWRTQYWTRRLRQEVYSATTPYGGYGGGDEDQGCMGALSVLMSIGLNSMRGLADETPFYDITSPLFDTVKLNLPNGNRFNIIAENNGPTNYYIRSALLNGRAYDACMVPRRVVNQGGTLKLGMSAEPNTRWGIKNLPPSVSKGREIPAKWALEPRVNLAFGKPCEASDEPSADSKAGFTTDRDRYWSRWASQAATATLTLDLQGPYALNQVRIAWMPGSLVKAYTVEVSLDKETWSQVYAVADNRKEGMTDIVFNPVSARYLRVNGQEKGSPWGYQISDVMVFGPRTIRMKSGDRYFATKDGRLQRSGQDAVSAGRYELLNLFGGLFSLQDVGARKFLALLPEGGLRFQAASSDDCAKFFLVDLGNGKVAFREVTTGKYLTLKGARLQATADQVRETEKFNVEQSSGADH